MSTWFRNELPFLSCWKFLTKSLGAQLYHSHANSIMSHALKNTVFATKLKIMLV